jgi:hypothetical protein
MATKLKKVEDQQIDQTIQEIEQNYFDSPLPEKSETELLSEELERAYLQIDTLKASSHKLMDFEQAAELFRKKAKLLDEIGQLESIRIKIQNTNITENNQKDSLDSYYYRLGLLYGSRDEPQFKISNLLVIEEFLNFIFVKLTAKIDELKYQVQEL